MSIRHGLLALLAEEPGYGYQLRAALEARTGGTWPLNIGQVYTTLSRLQRDGLVESADDGDAGQVVYRITEPGRRAVEAWFGSPVSRSTPARDELAIKLALAVEAPGIDVRRVVQVQRTHTMRALQEYTRLKAAAGGTEDLGWQLVLEALVFQAEAEVRWLDHCETTLARRAAERRPAQPAAPGRPDGQAPADRGPADRGPTDRGPADRGPADRGPADRGPADGAPADGAPDAPPRRQPSAETRR